MVSQLKMASTKKAAAKKISAKKAATKKATPKKARAKRVQTPAPAETLRAHLANDHAKNAVENFYTAFSTVRQSRNAAGAPTDGEQDLLRAAVVFAAAGLDTVIKELIRESLNKLARNDPDVQGEFEKFARRKLKSDPSVTGSADPSGFLAKILVSPTPYETLIESYIYELTGSSLQSVDELFKAAAALDIGDQELKNNREDLRRAFSTRNQIIHELDVRSTAARTGQRQRNSRTRNVLEGQSNLLLSIANHFIEEVEKKLAGYA